MRERRSEYDITDGVHLNDVSSVCDAVCTIYHSAFGRFNEKKLRAAFEDFEHLFNGEYSSYLPCDTLYHDKQHSMDMTLALARLINGYQRSVAKGKRIGLERAMLTTITALYHDAGYIRHESDHRHFNGAEYTAVHVSRSATFLKQYLHDTDLDKFSSISANMVHYTGYEIAPNRIRLPDKQWHMLGHMLGTADLIAQMSDRCYLEKCRDRLYPEFVLGGMNVKKDEHGREVVLYESGEDLLRQTPLFYEKEVEKRLNTLFNKVYNYEIAHFDGERYYINGLGKNQSRLKSVLKTDSLNQLRRKPPENYGTKNFPGLDTYLNQHPLKKIKL